MKEEGEEGGNSVTWTKPRSFANGEDEGRRGWD